MVRKIVQKFLFLLNLVIVLGLLVFVFARGAGVFFDVTKLNEGMALVDFGKAEVEMEVSDDKVERKNGLMNREVLEGGMIFVFENEGLYSFWMKNTLIPLDMIWLNEEYEVLEIVSAEPCEVEKCPTFGGNEISRYVIELNAGFAEEHEIKVGDKVDIKWG